VALAVHFCHPPQPDHLALLARLLDPGLTLTAGAELPTEPPVEILVCARPRRQQLAACPSLRAVIIPFAGPPDETLALMADFPGISLHNLHHNAAATAETALGLLLAAAKFILPVDRSFRSHDWTPRYEPPPIAILAGRTALILGYGAIGKRLAPMCQALGMQVIGVRRHEPDVPERDGVALYSAAHLAELLPRADVLICLLPHTPETEGLLGAEELALLPDHCILVNVGRGPVIDEEALYTALAERRIRAAGLDVWWQYPQGEEERSHTHPSRLPFHELDNVVMTPHRGGWLQSFETLRVAALAELLNAATEGREMPNRVNTELGY